MKSWIQFTKDTTIHGVRYLAKHSKYSRYVWFLILFASTSLCVWQSAVNIRDYLRLNVQTAITYDTIDQLRFPAITFWNSNEMRRTVVGRSAVIESMISVYHKIDMKKMNKTCSYPTTYRNKLDDFADDFISKIQSVLLGKIADGSLFFKIVYNDIQITREMTFAKCWWKKDEMNCTENVLNTVIGNSSNAISSFSVNLDRSLVEGYHAASNHRFIVGTNLYVLHSEKSTLDFTPANENYVINDTMGFWKDGIGLESGYRFLLNVNADEYCYYQKERWYGVGIHVVFHESESFPNEPDSKNTVYLEAGYHYTIVLKPVKYSRQTGHLGRCLSHYPLYIFDTNRYAKPFCEIQCAFETVWKICKCMSDMIISLNRKFAKYHGLNESLVLPCFSVDGSERCLYDKVFEGSVFPTRKFCSHCKDPCEEMVYEYEVSAVAFPPKHLGQYYSEILNISDEETVRKNYLMVNIFFESKSINVITETQMYTVRDLFIYLGNNAGLFLGMSFLSFFEPFLASICALLPKMKQKWLFWKKEILKKWKKRKKPKLRRIIANKKAPATNRKITKCRTVQVRPFNPDELTYSVSSL